MTEPSVDEIVAEYLRWSGPDDPMLLLIADWRKKGEALADISNQKPWAETSPDDLWIFHDYMRDRANAALTPQQPPPAKPPA